MKKKKLLVRKMKKFKTFFVILVIVIFSGQMAVAQDYNLSIWDFSGPYTESQDGMTLNYTLAQDAKGKVTGAGTFDYSSDNMTIPVEIKGKVKGKNEIVTLKFKVKGKDADANKFQSKVSLALDKSSLSLVGIAKGKLCTKEAGCVTAEVNVSLDVPNGMTGEAVLSIDATLDEKGKKLEGTGELILSNNYKYPLSVKGKYNSKKDETQLQIKGVEESTKGIKVKLKIDGESDNATFIKGKAFGQQLDLTATNKANPGLRYNLAAELDDSLLEKAQTMTAHIESVDIEVLGTTFEEFGVFESNFAHISVEEKSVSPIAIFFDEDMSAYPNAPDTIDGAFVTKMVSKDKIESYFDITIEGDQGTCSDIQELIYDNVLYKVLTMKERLRYSSEGKSLTILSELTNNRDWVPIDTASLITHEGDDYFFQPLSFYLSINTLVDIDELLKGTKYCKLLSHQAILSWMLEKSFEDDPVLLAPNPFVCNQPSSFEAQGGSCLVYFRQAQSYYCSDYTGYFFTLETGAEKCADRFDTDGGIAPVYSESPCSQRTAEIEAYIPGYVGFTGACVIHCQEENEFIWNIYTEDPEPSCGGWDFFAPEEVDAIK